MQDIPEIFNRISKINSIIEKKKILEETKSSILEKIFRYAYDPFINYGVSKIDTSDISYSNDIEVDEVWLIEISELLDKLSKRKYTGNKARDEVKKLLSKYPEEWGRILLHILKKDLRIGASKSIINKIYDGLFPEDICMAAMKYERKRVCFPVYADIKLDGVRCISTYKDSKIKLFSRNGKEFVNYPTISEELNQIEEIHLMNFDGEITMGHFQDIMRTVSRKEDGIKLAEDAVYNIFDIQINKPLFKRVQILSKIKKQIEEKNLKHIKVVECKEFKDEEKVIDFYNEMLKEGYEGIMIKNMMGLYRYKRSNDWLKMKPEETLDLEILNVEEGTGKYKNKLGAIICKINKDNDTVNVGSGFTDIERENYWNKRNELIGMIAEVKFQEKTKDGSLRFPVFVRFRNDK